MTEATETAEDKWKLEYAARLMDAGGMDERAAIQMAIEACNDGGMDWSPHGAAVADEEMSYWWDE